MSLPIQDAKTDVVQNLTPSLLTLLNTLFIWVQKMTAVRQAGLRLRIKKCNFGMTTLCVLGHVVDHFGLYPNPDQVAAVIDFLQPI